MIDIVGHFGSRFSFATVATEIARGLKEQGKLGRIVNFDDRLFESCADLEEHLSAEYSAFGFFVMLPVEHVAQLTRVYKKSALYISPNTDTLGRQYAEHMRVFDRTYVPSKWCYDSIKKSEYPEERIELIPLGCEKIYFDLRESAMGRIKERLIEVPKVLHLMTDGLLPGRKGTVEVIKAWNECKNRGVLRNATLTIHAPAGVSDEVYYYACKSKLFEPEVTIQTGAHRGVSPVELAYLMSDYDLVILPSRCEGFGMMILAALVLGVPMITTDWTGQRDFLEYCGGWIGPSESTLSPLGENEVGSAPDVDYMLVAEYLQEALDPEARKKLMFQSEGQKLQEYSWEQLRSQWASSLIKWSEGT